MKAAFYECDVTPPLGGYLPGYYCPRFADDVADRLYSRALVVEDNGNIAAIVSVDTCEVPEEMHEIVTKRIYEYTCISPESVCITSNHTHRGAPVSDSPELNLYADKPYTDVFFRLTADAVILAYKRLKEAKLYFAVDEVHGIAFNRNSVLEDGTYRTNYFGPRKGTLAGIDPTLTVIKVEIDDRPVGAIVNYALHQDTAEPITGYTGDYASVISDKLKEEYGNDFVTVFALGTCGDINHHNYDEKSKGIDKLYAHLEIGEIIAGKAIYAMNNALPIFGDISVAKQKITVKKRLTNDEKATEAIKKLIENKTRAFFDIRNIIYYNSVNITEDYDMYIQVIKIGDVCIYCLPGEIYVNWGLMLKEKSPFSKNILIENCNSFLGYVPTVEAFDDCSNLYEIVLCCHSCLVPEAGQTIVDKAIDIAKTLN